jgi:ubiquinol-cytochrome c reductase cytochrome b subunit
LFQRFFWILLIDIFVLGLCGMKPAVQPWVAIGQLATAYYFLHFLVILPLIARYERPLPLPDSISSSVLHGEKKEAAPYGMPTARAAAE